MGLRLLPAHTPRELLDSRGPGALDLGAHRRERRGVEEDWRDQVALLPEREDR
jgi:hypothetical protein